MSEVPHVLILGGGYVAINATRGLRKAIERGQIRATVVSRENYHLWHGFIGEMLTGRIAPGNILSPVRRIFHPARVHVGEIERIDLNEQRVTVSRHIDGFREELTYDHLLLCLGSAPKLDVYPGLAEHAFKLNSYDDCFRLRNHILTMFELADIEKDPAERGRLLTFFVAGGGFAGTEIAGELADYVRLLTEKDYPHISRDECRVVLVHSGETILPELYGNKEEPGGEQGFPRLVAYATRHLDKLGVEVVTNTRVSAVTPNEVLLSDGQRVPTRTVISAVGSKPPPLFNTMDIPRTPQGKVVTDSFFRVSPYENVWSAGDCAAVPHPDGGYCPPVGIFALKQGKAVAKNIVRAIEGAPLEPFRWPGLGQGVSIGRRTAVGQLRGIEVRGFPAWIMWRLLLFYHFPTWDRRLRLLADWLIWPFVGRDIVEMSVADADDYEITHNLFQTDEVIISEARVGRYVHVILEGEVEVARRSDDGHEVITTLGPGDHFGQTWLDAEAQEVVRAKTLVKTAALRTDQTRQLQQVLTSLARVLEQS